MDPGARLRLNTLLDGTRMVCRCRVADEPDRVACLELTQLAAHGCLCEVEAQDAQDDVCRAAALGARKELSVGVQVARCCHSNRAHSPSN